MFVEVVTWGDLSGLVFGMEIWNSDPVISNCIIIYHMAIEDEISPWTVGMHLATLLLIYAYIK